MRALPILIVCSLLASSCEQGSKAVPKNNSSSATILVAEDVLNDPFVPDDEQQNGHALMLSSSFTGTSANGREADMQLRYKVSPQIRPAVTSATQVVVSINENGRAKEIYREKLDTTTMQGKLAVTVEPSITGASLLVGLDHLNENIITGMPTYSTVAVPTALALEDSDLGRVAGVYVELVPGSYNTALIGDRREHRFTVRVLAKNDSPSADPDYCNKFVEGEPIEEQPATKPSDIKDFKPLVGLDKKASDIFDALEYGYSDTESPVTVSFSKESLGVYFVMDVSSSVVENGLGHHMLDAVARSVVPLARFSDFNYRIFGSNVYELGSLRDINFDDPAGSGTALYYAIDTALEDIESYAPAKQNKLIIAISDGKDLASRNFYPAFKSHDQVLDYVAQRIVNVQDGQNTFYESQLNVYFIDLPGASDSVGQVADPGMHKLAESSGSTHFVASDKQGLIDSLQTITDHVGGTYDLVYSSQQTPDDTDLGLLIHAGKCTSRIKLPTQHK